MGRSERGRPYGLLRRLGVTLVWLLLASLLLSDLAGAQRNGRALPFLEKAPKVTKQPASVTVEEGQSAIFEAAASGTPELSVTWEVSSNGGVGWSMIAGAVSTRLTLSNAESSESGYEFRAPSRARRAKQPAKSRS